jgi:hypothetical protein
MSLSFEKVREKPFTELILQLDFGAGDPSKSKILP